MDDTLFLATDELNLGAIDHQGQGRWSLLLLLVFGLIDPRWAGATRRG